MKTTIAVFILILAGVQFPMAICPADAPAVNADELLRQGKDLFQQKEYDEAAAQLELAVKANPQLVDAWNTLGWCRFRTGDLDQAQTDFSQALQINGQYANAHVGLGETYFALGQLKKAEGELTQAPSSTVAMRYLARIYMLQGRWSDAADDAQKILDAKSTNQNLNDFAQRILDAAKTQSLPEDLRKVIAPAATVRSTASSLSPGWTALDQDDLRRAREVFTQILQINAADIAAAQTALGRSLPHAQFTDTPLTDVLDNLRSQTGVNIKVSWNRLSDAGVDKETPIKLDLRDNALSQILTAILQQLGPGKFDYAIDTNNILITTAADADLADAFNGLGWVDLRAGDLNAAARDFSAATAKNNPEAKGPSNGLATVYLKQGKTAYAIQIWQQLADQFPGVNGATYGLADAYAAQGDDDKAAALYAQIVAAKPDDENAKSKLDALRKKIAATTSPSPQDATELAHNAARFLRQHNFADAMTACQQALKANPQMADVWITLGWCQFFTGDNESAQDSFQQAIQLQPQNPKLLNALGQFYFDRDELDKSEQYYSQVSSDPQVCLILTQICLLENKWDDAAKYAQKFLDSDQATGSDADDAQAMLQAAKNRNLPDDLKQKISPPPMPPQKPAS